MMYDIRLTKKADKDFSHWGKVEMLKAAAGLGDTEHRTIRWTLFDWQFAGARSLEFSAPEERADWTTRDRACSYSDR